MNKTKILALIAGTLIAFPGLASSRDLVISNATSYDLAFRVNGVCSPEPGMLFGYEVKFISDSELKEICGGSIKGCELRAYLDNCGGTYAGGTTFINEDYMSANGGDADIGVAVSGDSKQARLFFHN